MGYWLSTETDASGAVCHSSSIRSALEPTSRTSAPPSSQSGALHRVYLLQMTAATATAPPDVTLARNLAGIDDKRKNKSSRQEWTILRELEYDGTSRPSGSFDSFSRSHRADTTHLRNANDGLQAMQIITHTISYGAGLRSGIDGPHIAAPNLQSSKVGKAGRSSAFRPHRAVGICGLLPHVGRRRLLFAFSSSTTRLDHYSLPYTFLVGFVQ